MRAYYTICGATMLVPSLAFLMLFQPPERGLLRKLRSHKPLGILWVASALRVLATTLVLSGFRIMVLDIDNVNRPVIFNGWFDKATAVSTITFGAIASVVFFATYLWFRLWPDEDKEGD